MSDLTKMLTDLQRGNAAVTRLLEAATAEGGVDPDLAAEVVQQGLDTKNAVQGVVDADAARQAETKAAQEAAAKIDATRAKLMEDLNIKDPAVADKLIKQVRDMDRTKHDTLKDPGLVGTVQKQVQGSDLEKVMEGVKTAQDAKKKTIIGSLVDRELAKKNVELSPELRNRIETNIIGKFDQGVKHSQLGKEARMDVAEFVKRRANVPQNIRQTVRFARSMGLPEPKLSDVDILDTMYGDRKATEILQQKLKGQVAQRGKTIAKRGGYGLAAIALLSSLLPGGDSDVPEGLDPRALQLERMALENEKTRALIANLMSRSQLAEARANKELSGNPQDELNAILKMLQIKKLQEQQGGF